MNKVKEWIMTMIDQIKRKSHQTEDGVTYEDPVDSKPSKEGWIAKFQNWVIIFMRDRYGRFDSLNQFLLALGLIIFMLNIRHNFWVVNSIAMLIIIGAYYRFLSKNSYQRVKEATAFIRFKKMIQYKTKILFKRINDWRRFAYFECPECHQKLRAPRGKGNIKVTCSNCHHQFVTKT